ncbi:MAG: ecotropic viral integration site [Cirrosporium novae-zelandiae]|nr:MAG: ecotropic viral integration site [Cirrosporium novae-zelandiae]
MADSGQASEIRHFPTDSMVTVPLSSPPMSPNMYKLLGESPVNRGNIADVFGSPKNDLKISIPEERAGPEEEDCKTPVDTDQSEEGHGSEDSRAKTPTEEPKDKNGAQEEENAASDPRSRSSSGSTTRTGSSGPGTSVDWVELDKTEEQESRDDTSDESTALLLARLEQENQALETDPKAGLAQQPRVRSQSRPPSIHHLQRLVSESRSSSLRFSMLPAPPPMTELEFWAALVADYPQTAHRLPTLTSNKIRAGIPPPLRGVVWSSIAGARDRMLEDEFDQLSQQSSPYEGLIGKDIGRSFPGVEMFREPGGEGQRMLASVLKCFSVYDSKIGYCQGLGFVVGPLLMHMTDKEAFCVLVRLMEHYDLRSCFLPDLSGLHLRIYQFQQLLNHFLPQLASHLDHLQIEPVYVSQWFLSFFAVTCPLPMLLRIYDVLLAEGASETLMRVALSLMKRNEEKILGCHELEDVMHLLLSRSLWDTYASNANDLVNDFVSLTGLVTRESLQALEANFKLAQREGLPKQISGLADIQAAASRFLGRLWAGSHNSSKSMNLSPPLSASSRPTSILRRTPSKQSMASTLNSSESSFESNASTVATEISQSPIEISDKQSTLNTRARSAMSSAKDKDLQIEDLLTALSDMQREQAQLASDLQKEREEREEDQRVITTLLIQIKAVKPQFARNPRDSLTQQELINIPESPTSADFDTALSKAEERFSLRDARRSSILQTKHQLRDDVTRWKEQHNIEVSRRLDLTQRLGEEEHKNNQLREELREARSRLQDDYRDRQRLERTIYELRSRKPSRRGSSADSPTSQSSDSLDSRSSTNGLRELRLGRTASTRSKATSQIQYSKRTSSLSTQAVLSTENNRPAEDDTLLVELVNAKTAEAVAKGELEETKAKLDALKKMINANGIITNHRPSFASDNNIPLPSPTLFMSSLSRATSESPKLTPPQPSTTSSSGGGFFSGWGKRNTSASVASEGH